MSLPPCFSQFRIYKGVEVTETEHGGSGPERLCSSVQADFSQFLICKGVEVTETKHGGSEPE